MTVKQCNTMKTFVSDTVVNCWVISEINWDWWNVNRREASGRFGMTVLRRCWMKSIPVRWGPTG